MAGNDRILLSDEKNKLIIKNLTKEDCGEYQGEATNDVSVVNSICAILDVQCKDHFWARLTNSVWYI